MSGSKDSGLNNGDGAIQYDSDEFLTYLGEFVLRFALAENDLHRAVIKVAGLSRQVAVAVLSGSRVETDISYLRRLHEVKNEPIHRGLERALEQLAVINSLRNLILHNRTHHWVEPQEDGSHKEGRRLTNAARAIRPDAVREVDLTTQLLDGAIEDLGSIIGALWATINPTSASHWDPDQMLTEVARATWRYTPPSPKGAGRKNQSKPQKQKRQP